MSGHCGGFQTLCTPRAVYDLQVPAFLPTEGVFYHLASCSLRPAATTTIETRH